MARHVLYNDQAIISIPADRILAFGRLVMACLLSVGCATELPVEPENSDVKTPVIFGRALALVMGKTSRSYEPKVRFFELVNLQTKERFSIDVRSEDKVFMLPLPAGEYGLTRVQISEGPFLSMADYVARFDVAAEQLTFVGTWRFGIDTPRYNRMMVFSAVHDLEDQARAQQELVAQYPALDGEAVSTVLPSPTEADARLYEVMPYPRYQSYFRRHW